MIHRMPNRSGGIRMGRALALRKDYDAATLRALARTTKHAGQARRLPALAAIYDGASRGDVARLAGTDRQIVRDWVVPDRTLQQIGTQLEAMRERTPRGGTRWHPSSVKHLLGRAAKLGLTEDAPVRAAPEVWK